MRRLIEAFLILLLWGGPAGASSVSRVDFVPHQTSLSLGLFRIGIDHAFTESLSLGIVGGTDLNLWAGRMVYRLGKTPSGQSYGVSCTGGNPWIKPALNLAVPLGDKWKFRAEIGPVFRQQTDGWQLEGAEGAVWPALNLEFAYQLSPNSEITLLGDNLIGWRGSF